jgi:hypothetical protein
MKSYLRCHRPPLRIIGRDSETVMSRSSIMADRAQVTETTIVAIKKRLIPKGLAAEPKQGISFGAAG